MQSKTLVSHTGLKCKLCHELKDRTVFCIIGEVPSPVVFNYLNNFSSQARCHVEAVGHVCCGKALI